MSKTINISWLQFQQHFLKTNKLVYVMEDPEGWLFNTTDDCILIECYVKRSEKDEQNMAFVDRYLNNSNIIKYDFEKDSKPVRLVITQNDI